MRQLTQARAGFGETADLLKNEDDVTRLRLAETLAIWSNWEVGASQEGPARAAELRAKAEALVTKVQSPNTAAMIRKMLTPATPPSDGLQQPPEQQP